MTVKDMIEWLEDKPLDSIIVKGTQGSELDNHEELKFSEIGLIHNGETRRQDSEYANELF